MTLSNKYDLRIYERKQDSDTVIATETASTALIQNYFSLRQRPSEIILYQRVGTCLKLFQNYFAGLLQLMNVF